MADTTRWSEFEIARAIGRQVLQRRCLLLVDRCQWTGHEADVLGVTRNLRLIDIEIKISRGDLKADGRKDKWWHRGFGTMVDGKWVRPAAVAKLWPHSIWKHYYALPADIWKPELIDCLPSPASGVITVSRTPENWKESVLTAVIRRAKPNPDAKPISSTAVLDIARLANLRMWDSYEDRAQIARELQESQV